MNKIELEIVSLQSSVTHKNSYAVVLGEINGDRKIPIVIGGFEAQAIAVALENLQPNRPLTHDLMIILFNTFNITVQEVLIYRLEEAIFYSQLICVKDGEQVSIDCRTSDAIAIAIRTGCSIYANAEVVDASGIDLKETQGVEIEEDNEDDDNDELDSDIDNIISEELKAVDLQNMTLEELENYLNEVLEKEDYSMAIKIRDEIKNRNQK